MNSTYHWKIGFYEHQEGEQKNARAFSIPISCTDGPGRLFGFVMSSSPQITNDLIALADDITGTGEVRQSSEDWFEKILAIANRNFSTAIKEQGINSKKDELTVLWALQVRNSISLARHGKVHAFYARRIDRERTFEDLFESDPSKDKNVLFEDVVSGMLGSSDKLFITGHELLNYVSLPRLQTLVDGRREKIEDLHSVLGDLPRTLPIVAALMHSVKIDNAVRVAGESPAESLENLMAKTRDTESWLSPRPIPSMKGVIKRAVDTVGNLTKRSSRKNKDSDVATEDAEVLKEIKTTKPEKPTANVSEDAPEPGKGTLTRLVSNLPETARNLPARLFNRIKTLPGISRWILIGVVVLLVALAVTIGTLSVLQKRDQDVAAYNESITEIQQKRNVIEASMIYGDEGRAWSAYDQAKIMIAALPQKTEAQKQTLENLAAQLEKDAEKLRRISRVSTEIVSTLVEVNLSSPMGMVLRGTDIVVADSGGLIVSFPIDGGAANVLSVSPNQTYSAIGLNEDTVVLSNGQDTYHLKGGSVENTESSTLGSNEPADLAFWSRKLYSLIPGQNQIMRSSRSGAGWGDGSEWITSSSNISNAVALSIDGSIWVALSDGKVKKFFSGKEESFALKRIDPALTSITDMKSPSGSGNLYLFDPAGKRVVVMSKEGELLTQFLGEWSDPRAFSVSEENKAVYVLDGNSLTKFDLP